MNLLSDSLNWEALSRILERLSTTKLKKNNQYTNLSCWLIHRSGSTFYKKDLSTSSLFNRPDLCCHPYIVGEVAVGNLGNRKDLLAFMQRITSVEVAKQEFLLKFVREQKLYAKGIGFVDCHLLASAKIRPNTLIWTSDRRMKKWLLS